MKWNKEILVKIVSTFICVIALISYNLFMINLFPDSHAPFISILPLVIFAFILPILIWRFDLLKILYTNKLVEQEPDKQYDIFYEFESPEEITNDDGVSTLLINEDLQSHCLAYTSINDGVEFENYIAELLIKTGYNNVEVTQASNDYGIDVVAEKMGITYVVQCKFYSSPVGVSAIQEVHAGKAHYKANVGIVATNNRFTSNALELAKSVGVVLWDGTFIESLTTNLGEPFLPKVDKSSLNDINIDDVIKYFIIEQRASTSMIQRKYRIGYQQASKIIDELEAMRVIGTPTGSLPRSVFYRSFEDYLKHK